MHHGVSEVSSTEGEEVSKCLICFSVHRCTQVKARHASLLHRFIHMRSVHVHSSMKGRVMPNQSKADQDRGHIDDSVTP